MVTSDLQATCSKSLRLQQSHGHLDLYTKGFYFTSLRPDRLHAF
jgi:hypothetical protein